MVLGFFLILSVSPAAALFMRRQPEDIGILPDGDPPAGAPVRQKAQSQTTWVDTEYPWTLRRALRTRSLWALLGTQVLAGAVTLPIIMHQVAYIQDKGFAPQTATAIATTLALFALVGKLPWGYISERVHVRWVTPLCLVPTGLSVFLLVGAKNTQMLYAYAVFHGLTMGGYPTLMNVAWATYFGRQHMGAIRGVIAPVGQAMGAISPVFAAWMWDRLGSYDLPFTVFAIVWITAGLLMLLA